MPSNKQSCLYVYIVRKCQFKERWLEYRKENDEIKPYVRKRSILRVEKEESVADHTKKKQSYCCHVHSQTTAAMLEGSAKTVVSTVGIGLFTTPGIYHELRMCMAIAVILISAFADTGIPYSVLIALERH
jgi:hypothetical protein